MKRIGIFKLDEVLPFVVFSETINELHKRGLKRCDPEYKAVAERKYKGHMVKMASLRYQLFATKGVKCVKCGIEGLFFSLEQSEGGEGEGRNANRYHFNLYGLKEGGNIENPDTWVLITKDHIVSRKKGGKDILPNLQVMCSDCNRKKGAKHDEAMVERALETLESLLRDVEATGGVLVNDETHEYGLSADPQWFDLAVTTLNAYDLLKSMGRKPKLTITKMEGELA